MAGDFALSVTQIFPIAAPVAIGVLFFNVTAYYWIGGAGILLFAWLLRPTFRFDGRELKVGEAPVLFRELGALSKQLEVPEGMCVFLDGSFNASAAETRGLFGVAGTTRALTLGVPLLAVLSREQALAVIAHELGHFSRRHGVLGHWVYRARVGWERYAHYVDESDSVLDQAAAWYARQFVPYFSARSFAYSRQCEYEADADAASVVGAREFSSALTRVAVVGRFWEEILPREIAGWRRLVAEPPADFHERVAAAVARMPGSELQSLLDKELGAPSSTSDTHPSLAERLGAIGSSAELSSVAESAGSSLLGSSWPAARNEFDARWAKVSRREWLQEHLRSKHVNEPLLVASRETRRTWDVEEQLRHARALREVDPDEGMRTLGELRLREPSHRRLKFAYAAALLNELRAEGVDLMESLAREAPAFRVEAFLRVLQFHQRKDDREQTQQWRAWLDRAANNLGEAIAEFARRAEAGVAGPSSLPDTVRGVLAEAVRMDGCVRDAFLLEGEAALSFAPDRPAVPITVHLLVLAIDPQAAKAVDEDEEGIRAHYEDFLKRFVHPDQASMVRTYYTTENMPAVFSRGRLSG